MRLTCRMDSSSMSLKMVPLIWLGFKATQFSTGNLNFVWIGFFIFTAVAQEKHRWDRFMLRWGQSYFSGTTSSHLCQGERWKFEMMERRQRTVLSDDERMWLSEYPVVSFFFPLHHVCCYKKWFSTLTTHTRDFRANIFLPLLHDLQTYSFFGCLWS